MSTDDDAARLESGQDSEGTSSSEGNQERRCCRLRREARGVATSGEFSADSVWGDHETAWKSIKDVDPGQEVIFGHIEIAQDGGLGQITRNGGSDGIDRLWYGTRPLGTLIVIFFIGYNFYFVMNNAKNVIYGRDIAWTDFTLEILKDIFNGTADEPNQYLVSTYLLGTLLTWIHPQTEWAALLSSFVVMLEVVMLLSYILFFTVVRLLQASFFAMLCCECCGKQRWKRWFYIAEVFFDTIPSLQSFSAMRLLYYIVPQVATQHLFNILFYVADYKVLRLIWFILSRLFCLIVGLDCFLIKYRGVETAILTDKFDVTNVMNAVIFLNQVLGVVQLKWAVRDRLYRFVFGGCDGIMTQPENVRRDIWEAKVAQRIWRSYPCWKAFSISMTWNDDDFQALVLRDVAEEDRPERSARVARTSFTASREIE